MKLICKRRSCYALFFTVSICLAMWFGAKFMVEAASAFGAISVASLIFLVRQSRLLYDVTLIWDNRILAVPSALISMAGGQEKNDTEETVVSTFGMLIGSKIYRRVCDELKTMIDEAAEAWRLCESMCVQTEELADYAQSLKNPASAEAATMSYTYSRAPVGFLTAVAYAAEENAATRWAKDLTTKFDAYPSGEKNKIACRPFGNRRKKGLCPATVGAEQP